MPYNMMPPSPPGLQGRAFPGNPLANAVMQRGAVGAPMGMMQRQYPGAIAPPPVAPPTGGPDPVFRADPRFAGVPPPGPSALARNPGLMNMLQGQLPPQAALVRS